MRYSIQIANRQFNSDKSLDYTSEEDLMLGQVVVVPLRNKPVLGIVYGKSETEHDTKDLKQIIRLVADNPLPKTLLELFKWSGKYYPAPLGHHLQLALPPSIIKLDSRKTSQSAELSGQTPKNQHTLKPSTIKPTLTDTLTPAQVNAINKLLNNNNPAILHGVTGSGKTRVYMELAKDAISRNKSVIILTPEIGLTSQLAKQFEEFFTNVIVYHSNQTDTLRRTTWRGLINSDKPHVIVGPRSALFLPINNVGLIVIDEFHDTAYKQDQSPRYQTTHVAGKLASLSGAKLITGSATPSVNDYYTFKIKGLDIIEMNQLASTNVAKLGLRKTSQSPELSSKVDTLVIDIKDRTNFRQSTWISEAIIKELPVCLQNKKQAILYLNRRGTARLVVCENCGWQATCPRCDIGLTYHGDKHILHCHLCDFKRSAPSTCPECKQPALKYKSVGTKLIYSEVKKLFPDANIARFDSDNIKSESLESLYSDVESGNIDILIGTKMLSKGLDLPNLSLVGIIIAESSLLMPDFSAAETEFQQITQIRGRLGRSSLPGKMIIQSHQPDGNILSSAIKQDYATFYNDEIASRQKFIYPPFCHMLIITVSRARQTTAQANINKIIQGINKLSIKATVLGPSPSYYEKIRNQYRWQCVVKSKTRSDLIKIIEILPKTCSYDLDPVNLL